MELVPGSKGSGAELHPAGPGPEGSGFCSHAGTEDIRVPVQSNLG